MFLACTNIVSDASLPKSSSIVSQYTSMALSGFFPRIYYGERAILDHAVFLPIKICMFLFSGT